jgi:hypothetical protein
VPQLPRQHRFASCFTDVTRVNVSAGVKENHSKAELNLPIKSYRPEQIATLLWQVEVEIVNGKTTPQACKEAEGAGQIYQRWTPSARSPRGEEEPDQARTKHFAVSRLHQGSILRTRRTSIYSLLSVSGQKARAKPYAAAHRKFGIFNQQGNSIPVVHSLLGTYSRRNIARRKQNDKSVNSQSRSKWNFRDR